MFLMSCEVWDKAERVELLNLTSERIYFAPLFFYEKDKAVSVFYDFSDPKQAPVIVSDYYSKDISRFDILKSKFDEDSKKVREFTSSKEPKDLEKLFVSLLNVWPLIALASSLSNIYGIDSSLLDRCVQVRKESDGLLHWANEQFYYKALNLVPHDQKDNIEYLKISEVLKSDFPAHDEISRRKKSYVFYRGVLYSGKSLDVFAKENDINFFEDEVDVSSKIQGNTAYGGKVIGKVKIVYERKDIGLVEIGDILVTPMTTPNLIEAMNKAAAFVTDEGGITCHAAIIAREMKKPCIIGTKIATQVLKDGDMVEVDAEKGVVRILNKNEY